MSIRWEYAADLIMGRSHPILEPDWPWVDGGEDVPPEPPKKLRHPERRKLIVATEAAISQGKLTPLDRKPVRRNVTPGARFGRPAGKYGLISDDELRALHRVHASGWSLRKLGQLLWEVYGYRTPASMANTLSSSFKRLGLDARDRLEATRLESVTHGLVKGSPEWRALRRQQRIARGETLGAPRCAGVRQQYPRKGEPCQNYAQHDSEFCPGHDPRRAEFYREHLARAREMKT